MKYQIVISPDSKLPLPEKGDFFESIIREILETQRYKITQRVNFTGMEIDLKAEHKDRKETAYVECKAREKLDTTDIRNFAFNVDFHEVSFGYFLSTTEFEHQVAGLIDEMSKKEKYHNLYFWGPEKIIELLVDAKIIRPLNSKIDKYFITKEILVYTSFGVFYILLLKSDSIPSHYTVIDAISGEAVNSKEILSELSKRILDIENLKLVTNNKEINHHNEIIENIAEIQESEQWYDYLPASSKYFIGRDDLRSMIFSFLNQVRLKTTSRRIFFIDGKSGWGKSSLISDLRGRTKAKYYKNKFFTLAIDARSASSSKFVALSFSKLLQNAIKEKFIERKYKNIEIVSDYDIFSHSTQEMLKILEKKGKVLILVFDQFEDIFRKPGLFRAFYKFLMDVDSVKSNLVIGFSWKSEVTIPIDHEAYYLWQQARSFSLSIPMREFNSSEVKGLVKQLETALGEDLIVDLKRRLVESSQGFPWLLKKLCIHVWHQIESGISQESLVDQDLNCEVLFKKDLEELSQDEIKALKHIAKRSYDGDSFDVTEIDEVLHSQLISVLVHKRLVIKSGTKYNIYWDIFRDYLVTGEVPTIGESYILRQRVNSCEIVYNILVKNKGRMTLKEIKKGHPRNTREVTIDNVLRELRNLGLVQKDHDYFVVTNVNEKDFKIYMQQKFHRYTPYIKIKQAKEETIELNDIIQTLKSIFIGSNFYEKTWRTYATTLIDWLEFLDPVLAKKIAASVHNRSASGNRIMTFTPQSSPEDDIKVFKEIKNASIQKNYKSLFDLKALGVIDYKKNVIKFTTKGELLSKSGDKILNEFLAKEAVQFWKISSAAEFLRKNPDFGSKEIKKYLPQLTENINSYVYKNKTNRLLYKWGKFANENLPI